MKQVLALENALTTESKIPHIKSVKRKSWCLVKTQEWVWTLHVPVTALQLSLLTGLQPLPMGHHPKAHLLYVLTLPCPAQQSRFVPPSFPGADDISQHRVLSLPTVRG